MKHLIDVQPHRVMSISYEVYLNINYGSEDEDFGDFAAITWARSDYNYPVSMDRHTIDVRRCDSYLGRSFTGHYYECDTYRLSKQI